MKKKSTKPLWEKEVFTTGEAARICRVSHNTINRCFDSGLLKGYKIPGSNFRRIPRAALLKFIEEEGLSANFELITKPKISAVSFFTDNDSLFSSFIKTLGERFIVTKVQTSFDAGLNYESGQTLVIDTSAIDFAILVGILSSIQKSNENKEESLRILLLLWNGNQYENYLSNSGFKIIRCSEDFNYEKLTESLSLWHA